MLYDADVYEDGHVYSEELDDASDADFPPRANFHPIKASGSYCIGREASNTRAISGLIERPVLTLQTVTPMTQYGIWDCARLHLNLYDWAGNYGVASGRRAQE